MPTYRADIGIVWDGGGSPGVNTWHFRNDDEVLNTSIQEVIDAIALFYEQARNLLHESVRVTCPNEIIKDPYGSPEFQAVDGWTKPGTGVGSLLPPATQVVVGWRTTSATRSGRGRTFVGPLSADCLEANGTPASNKLGFLQDAANQLVSDSQGWNQAAIGVYSAKQGVLRDIQSARVRDVFAVLRSRRD